MYANLSFLQKGSRLSYLLIIYLGFVFSNPTVAQVKSNADSIANTLFKTGCSFYNTDPDKCMTYLDSAQKLFKEIGNKKMESTCLLNMSFIYSDKKNNIKEAIRYAQNSALASEQIKDTLREANVLKYLGELQGKIGDFNEGKSNIHKAIMEFNSKNNLAGLAVSYSDLGHIYENQNMLDSCIYFINKAKAYWEKKDHSRLFQANYYLLHIYMIMSKIDDAYVIYKENLLLPVNDMYWQDRLDFFKYSEELFNKKGDKQLADMYKLKYVSLSDSLKKANIVIDN